MKLNLKRPLIFFDLETTGINVSNDRIVEISLIKVHPDGTESQHTTMVNPGRPIPAEATAVHHITDEMVKDKPMFKDIAESLSRFFLDSDIAGYNSNRFDVPMLAEEFSRAGVAFDFSKVRFIDVQTIFHKKEQRTLTAAYRFYCDRDLTDAHSATADTRATYEVLMAQLDRYPDLDNDVDKLAAFSSQNRNVDLMGRMVYDDRNREIINFGKYKGRVAEEVLRTDPGYLSWILQGDFTQNTKNAFIVIEHRIKTQNKPHH